MFLINYLYKHIVQQRPNYFTVKFDIKVRIQEHQRSHQAREEPKRTPVNSHSDYFNYFSNTLILNYRASLWRSNNAGSTLYSVFPTLQITHAYSNQQNAGVTASAFALYRLRSNCNKPNVQQAPSQQPSGHELV